MNTNWHFPIMIITSLFLFLGIILLVLGRNRFQLLRNRILLTAFLCVFIGMLLGKYGANAGLKWWIYYPVPMLMNVFIPPYVLHLNKKSFGLYLFLSFISAPLLHILFSFFLNWGEYMPFWKLSYIGDFL